MVRIYPFAAMLPTPDYADQVACRVGGGATNELLKAELESNPFTYLHVIKAGIHFGEKTGDRDMHYRFARNYFGQMMEQKVLVQRSVPGIYIYRQTYHDGHIFEGIVAGVSVIDYLGGSIKKHEYTLTDKEARMAEHVTRTGVVGEPVLLSNPDEININDWIRRHKPGESILSFEDEQGIFHEIWSVEEHTAILEIQQAMKNLDSLYIADGHHRIAASSLYLTHMHNEMNWPQEQMCFMAYILPESSLWIKPFHRLVRNIGEEGVNRVLDLCGEHFHIASSETAVTPQSKGEFGLYTRNGWHRLNFKVDGNYHTPAENLDVTRLENYVFRDILGIVDSKSDNRLSFLRGDMPLVELETIVNSGTADLALVLYPNTMSEIKAVADANQTMPPKSTWIEPKLLTGMIIQKF